MCMANLLALEGVSRLDSEFGCDDRIGVYVLSGRLLGGSSLSFGGLGGMAGGGRGGMGVGSCISFRESMQI